MSSKAAVEDLLVLEEVELRVANWLEPDSDTIASWAVDTGNVDRSAWCQCEESWSADECQSYWFMGH